MISPSLLTPQAWQDVIDIVAYIGTDNPDAAARFLEALDATVEQVAALPGMGSVRDVAHPDLQGARVLPVTGFEHYLIFYLPAGTSVQVLRLLHTARDFPTMFA